MFLAQVPDEPKMTRRTHKRIPRSRSKQANRRAMRPSIFEAIQNANSRAHQRANQRAWRRQGLTSVRAAIADTHDEEYLLSLPQLTLRTLLGFLLLIPSVISTLALFTITDVYDISQPTANVWSQLISSKPFLFFAVGTFLMLGWFFSKIASQGFLYLYVLGHELTHALFIYICGGKVSGFKVTTAGGYVMTNKSNILISLSPYFVPFWSVVVLLISLVLRLFWQIPYLDEALYLLIGTTWTFHLVWTLWMIPRDQPDLKENGTFFSLVVIYLANVLLLATLLCLVPQGLTFSAYLYNWAVLFMDFIELSYLTLSKYLPLQ
ncbi:hypothetical protein Rhal01_00738 [Rubritalea halochordaticola]|uniref:Uncharacterized protein n=2 Tax=Rubritalea halochordaticola TaxID=714537 RepID=A0ABP9UVU2_9BACT